MATYEAPRPSPSDRAVVGPCPRLERELVEQEVARHPDVRIRYGDRCDVGKAKRAIHPLGNVVALDAVEAQRPLAASPCCLDGVPDQLLGVPSPAVLWKDP